ncbi:MAG TPA: hypothetical protein VFE33_27790 [Thermoanaerobaculia bacterium]|nr:hypothetical protein [Thermoanaerobaculia bacterium]
MTDDPIVQEVRRIREEYAAQFNYDLQAIFADLKRSEAARDPSQAPLVEPPEAGTEEDASVQRIRFAHR